MSLRFIWITLMALLIASCSTIGDSGSNISVSKAIMRNSSTAGEDVAAYAAFDNHGPANRITSAHCTCAKRVELHQVIRKDGKVSMETVWPYALPAQTRSEVVPGSAFHFMLIEINRPFNLDEKVVMTFTMERGPALTVPFLIVTDSAKAWAAMP
jgi:copper(I)-binding protein